MDRPGVSGGVCLNTRSQFVVRSSSFAYRFLSPPKKRIVIVGGLISDLVMSIFLLPTLYVWMAGEHEGVLEPAAYT